VEKAMTAEAHPERILKDLHDLWITLGKEESGTGDGVLRACALTLIVMEQDDGDTSATGETLAELMRDYPSRAIVLRVRPGEGRALEARVFAQCWLPFGRRKQICSEQIEITAGRLSLAAVPPILLALAAPDLPVVMWRRSASLAGMREVAALEALADKLILDSDAAGDVRDASAVLSAARQSGAPFADLAWTRLTAWRETIAQVFDCPLPRTCLPGFREITVLHGRGGISISACYLAGWLSVALGWDPLDPRLRFSETGNGDLAGMTLSAPGSEIEISRQGEQSLIARINGMPHRASAAARSQASLIGEEISIAGRDPIYERSLAAALAIAGRSR
jgi:glucose-6-phosphate dehydrogenase assembly protein OpcA